MENPNRLDPRTPTVDGEPVAQWVVAIEFSTSLGQPVECKQPEAHNVQGLPVVCEDPEHTTAAHPVLLPELEAEAEIQ